MSEQQKIKVLELFAGYGGASFALKKAGIEYECVGYSDIKKHAIKCYELNHPNIKNFGDITKIDPSDIPDFDLLTGGFPCQDVSSAGLRDLSKNRTNLFQEILRIAKVKQPKYMVLENVKGIETMDNGRYLLNICSEIKKIGYGVIFKCLNTCDYGIPQNRERIFIICKLGEWELGEFQFPVEKKLSLSYQDLLEHNVDENFFLSSERIEKIFKSTRFGNTIIRYRSYSKELRRKEIIPCLTGTDASNIYLTFDNKVRRLTPKECFRFMGFINDEIDLSNISNNQAYNLAGNGWDINLVSLLFKELYRDKP